MDELTVPRLKQQTIVAAVARGPAYMAQLCTQAPLALDVLRKTTDLVRITAWNVDCAECHELVLDLLVEWVVQDECPIFLARGDKPNIAVLYGKRGDMPGHLASSTNLPARKQPGVPCYTWTPKRGNVQTTPIHKKE